jgi:hypothetical protein
MKATYLTLTILASVFSANCYSQITLNGDFEYNSGVFCHDNLTNGSFNTMMDDCFAFGLGNELDIQSIHCGLSSPASGKWFISLATNAYSFLTDGVSISLNSMLTAGNTYKISYFEKADTSQYTHTIDSLLIGISSASSMFGVQIFSSFPQPETDWTNWTRKSFLFTAPSTFKYLTFKNKGNVHGWNFIDNVQIEFVTSIKDNYLNSQFEIFPNPFSLQTTLQTQDVLCDAILTVYNSFGRIVKQIENISGHTVVLSRDNLPAGLYFFQLKQDNKVTILDKLIITD